MLRRLWARLIMRGKRGRDEFKQSCQFVYGLVAAFKIAQEPRPKQRVAQQLLSAVCLTLFVAQ